jgi:hypothetical protein
MLNKLFLSAVLLVFEREGVTQIAAALTFSIARHVVYSIYSPHCVRSAEFVQHLALGILTVCIVQKTWVKLICVVSQATYFLGLLLKAQPDNNESDLYGYVLVTISFLVGIGAVLEGAVSVVSEITDSDDDRKSRGMSPATRSDMEDQGDSGGAGAGKEKRSSLAHRAPHLPKQQQKAGGWRSSRLMKQPNSEEIHSESAPVDPRDSLFADPEPIIQPTANPMHPSFDKSVISLPDIFEDSFKSRSYSGANPMRESQGGEENAFSQGQFEATPQSFTGDNPMQERDAEPDKSSASSPRLQNQISAESDNHQAHTKVV